MKKFTVSILKFLGFRREKPKTRMGRYLRRGERSVVVMAVLYLGLHLYPQALFAHRVTVDGITLYARQPLGADAEDCLARAATLLRASELAIDGRTEEVFLCNSRFLFRLFSPRGEAFAVSVPVTDHVFIAAADPASDTAHMKVADNNRRAFSAVVAHEVTHGLIRKRSGLWREFRLPEWVVEGYCEFVAREGSFPDERGFALLLGGESDESGSFRYFCYRQVVTYLMDERGFTVDDLMDRSDDYDGFLAEMIAHRREAQAEGTPAD